MKTEGGDKTNKCAFLYVGLCDNDEPFLDLLISSEGNLNISVYLVLTTVLCSVNSGNAA